MLSAERNSFSRPTAAAVNAHLVTAVRSFVRRSTRVESRRRLCCVLLSMWKHFADSVRNRKETASDYFVYLCIVCSCAVTLINNASD